MKVNCYDFPINFVDHWNQVAHDFDFDFLNILNIIYDYLKHFDYDLERHVSIIDHIDQIDK